MDAFKLIAEGVLGISCWGLLVLVASAYLGYLIIGKFLNPDIRLRWFILISTIVLFSCISVNPTWIANLSHTDYQNLRFGLIVRMIPVGVSVGQMFGGSKVHIERKKKNEGENGEEEEE